MSRPFTHNELKELLGAYAVNAIDPEEHTIINVHLEACDDCRHEVDHLLESAALLGSSVPGDMPDLWTRIRDQIATSDEPPALQLPRAVAVDHTKQLRLPRVWWITFGVAATIALITGTFAAGMAANRSESNSQSNDVAATALTTPGARIINLTSQTDTNAIAKLVLLPNGRGYIYASTLPKLTNDRAYQLWAIVNNQPISAGVIGPSIAGAAFSASGPISAFAITDEIAGGVINSNRTPVVIGQVTT